MENKNNEGIDSINNRNDRNFINDTSYISYEYQGFTVPKELSSLCRDSYPCFGWEFDQNRVVEEQNESMIASQIPSKKKSITLYFRRNRAINNKTELTRLQRNFDSCIRELVALEREKTTQATIVALTVSVLGTAFMAGSTFAIIANPPMVWLMILLAIPGILGWISPYFLYRTLVRKKTSQIEPLIEKKYDEIYQVCEQGNRLLH